MSSSCPWPPVQQSVKELTLEQSGAMNSPGAKKQQHPYESPIAPTLKAMLAISETSGIRDFQLIPEKIMSVEKPPLIPISVQIR
jgi:hypothetical protein